MKKLIISITIISFMNLIGCYYQEQMVPSDFNFNDEEDIEVTIKDTTYNLIGKDYYFENDRLFATVSKKIDNQTTLKYNIEIPVEDMKELNVKRTNIFLTTILVVGVLIIPVTLIVAAIADDGGQPTPYYGPHGL